MRMRGAQSYYRTYDKLTEVLEDMEKLIKLCIVAFPSLWVSCNVMLSIASC